MSALPLKQAGRIAYRNVDGWVMCYFAAPDTMEGKLELSRIRTSILELDPELWPAWRRLMECAFARFFKEATGHEVKKFVESVPPPEAGGNA